MNLKVISGQINDGSRIYMKGQTFIDFPDIEEGKRLISLGVAKEIPSDFLSEGKEFAEDVLTGEENPAEDVLPKEENSAEDVLTGEENPAEDVSPGEENPANEQVTEEEPVNFRFNPDEVVRPPVKKATRKPRKK